ncbi:Stk1 family PASTA domain-containing Ser/Thr kinase [Streptomyces alboniger]|uniref:non-specific serine/threonine protein kinase n=1 Tax=Streptomyces alboniger TaxID=132473 RepID=A0A5J6HQ99_STRAD|nr:Stk1 family PASTA domain-containing Ser/Thr kinase [Streptomyces alboniger]QEV19115.1 Stk1 family PASTA domain-containing Ser/Thr kinase [Streptomyces alboniger]
MEEPRRLGGRYELGQVLGRGGMAEVYLAHDTRLGRTVAVKTLRVDLARDPSFQARFRREAQSAASLNHPAIVAVYDTGEDYVDGVSIPYIVMEYVDGSTLRELLHSGRKLLPERAMEMTIGILQALEYSHRNGIVHRDIKPANVMLTRNGQVKVMDFGIARAMGESGMTMTQTAAVIGTAQYLSPEQAKGEQVDARSDLYSTGCLLYELLTVRPPFVGDSPVAVAYQHVREEPQAPSVFDGEITPEMDAIVLKALTKDPDYRYQSADEMRADIEACLDGQPVAATAAMGAVGYGGTDGYGADQQTAMLRPQNGGQTAMMPPVSPEGGYGSDEAGHGRRQKKSNASTWLLILAGVLVLVGAILIGKFAFSGDGGSDGQMKAPDLVGETEAEAKDSATNVGLKFKVGERKACAKYPKGEVCDQTPEADADVEKGDTVTVTVSTGSPKILVPDVQGLSYEEARSQLKAKGFTSIERETEESDRTPGKVIGQDPPGDSKIEKSETITLTVAEEKKQVNVPDVTGLDYAAAEKQLKANGFAATRSDVASDEVDEGKVIKTTPSAGTPADPGSTVAVQVAKAPEETTVPTLMGQKLKDARKAIEDAGLSVGTITGPQDDDALVVLSTPGAGEKAEPGTAVDLTTAGGGGNGNGGGNGGNGGGDDGGGFIGGLSQRDSHRDPYLGQD